MSKPINKKVVCMEDCAQLTAKADTIDPASLQQARMPARCMFEGVFLSSTKNIESCRSAPGSIESFLEKCGRTPGCLSDAVIGPRSGCDGSDAFQTA